MVLNWQHSSKSRLAQEDLLGNLNLPPPMEVHHLQNDAGAHQLESNIRMRKRGKLKLILSADVC